VSVAIDHLRRQGLRVAYLDLDVHHGGRYHLHAAVRIWALLTHHLRNDETPEQLPAPWRHRWANALEGASPLTLHDDEPSFDVPRREEIQAKNERTSTQVLEHLAPYWY
jgi:hypothetical protein